MAEHKTKRPVSTGKCERCGATFSKAAMTNHLKSCLERQAASEKPSSLPGKRIFHLVVEGRDLPMYWIHLAARADATLADLDEFLRITWLECCGHLSAFHIGGKRFEPMPLEDAWYEAETMDAELGDLITPGMKIPYEYDFGTTTDLTIKVVAERAGQLRGKVIQMLARNDAPTMLCESCGAAAKKVCSVCIWSGSGWVCNKCARKHKCGDEMFLPVVNSPRVGMCGYAG